MIVSFAEDFYDVAPAAGAMDRRAREFKAAPAAAAPPAPIAAKPVAEPAKPVFATLDAGAFQASFKVSGRVSVPRDGSPKTFALSATTLVGILSGKANKHDLLGVATGAALGWATSHIR